LRTNNIKKPSTPARDAITSGEDPLSGWVVSIVRNIGCVLTVLNIKHCCKHMKGNVTNRDITENLY
jgi:hypothetical protein